MRAVDTNILVRILARDDPAQTPAADRFIEQGAWVSLPALAEAMWVLSSVYDKDANEIAAAVAMVLNHTQLVVQEPDVVDSALQRFRDRPSVGFFDCLLLEIARKSGHLPLGTFDRDLSKLDGAERVS